MKERMEKEGKKEKPLPHTLLAPNDSGSSQVALCGVRLQELPSPLTFPKQEWSSELSLALDLWNFLIWNSFASLRSYPLGCLPDVLRTY